jgi:hypothetical protein
VFSYKKFDVINNLVLWFYLKKDLLYRIPAIFTTIRVLKGKGGGFRGWESMCRYGLLKK